MVTYSVNGRQYLFPTGCGILGNSQYPWTKESLFLPFSSIHYSSGVDWAHPCLHPLGPRIIRRKGSVLFLISSGEKKTRNLPDQLTLTAPISWQATQKRAQGRAFRRFEAIAAPQNSQVP